MRKMTGISKAKLQRFKSLLELLPYTPKIVHASNSATTLWHADTIFLMLSGWAMSCMVSIQVEES